MMFNMKILDLNKCSDIHMQIKPNKNNTYLRFLSLMKNPLYLMLTLSLFHLSSGDMEISDVKIFEVCFIFVAVPAVENNNN